MPHRHFLLATFLALLLAPPALTALAQGEEELSLIGLSRAGDRVQLSMRANDGLRNVIVRLLADGAVVALPDWEQSTWRSGEVRTWNFTLLRDVDVVDIAWQARDDGADISATITISLPPSSFDEPLSLVGVSREEDSLDVRMRANEPLTSVVVRLMAEDAIAGLPEWRRESWEENETASWSFDLLREVSQARVSWQARDADGVPRSGSIIVTVPAAPPAEELPHARLVVTSATVASSKATITVTNYGDATARNVVVAVEDAQQKRIGSPLTQLISTLGEGQRASVDFTLLQDVTDIVVVLDHANVSMRTPLTLRKGDGTTTNETGGLNVTLSTDLPFREVDLGRSADYAVQVKNNGAPSLVQLRVDGLPQGYSARFFVGGSAVPSLYLDRNQTRQATMTITVPAQRTEVDRTVDFTVIASVNGTEATRLAMGVAVRGVGQLEVSSSDSEANVPAGGQATFQVTIRNSGSAPVFNVEIDSRRPYGWTVRVEPRRVDRIDPGQTAAVSVEVRAPDVLGAGRYSVDVAAKAGDMTSRYVPLALSVDEPEAGGGWVWGVMLVIIAGVLGSAAWWKWRR